MKNYYKLKDVISIFEDDAERFYGSGNKAAGTRLRKAMQEVKVLSQALRSEVSDIKKKAVKEVKEDLVLY